MIMKVHSVDLRILGVPTGCVFFLISLVFYIFLYIKAKAWESWFVLYSIYLEIKEYH